MSAGRWSRNPGSHPLGTAMSGLKSYLLEEIGRYALLLESI
ncbi:MAG: hypothetical protein ABJE95_22715 [Byssovorax sp.]